MIEVIRQNEIAIVVINTGKGNTFVFDDLNSLIQIFVELESNVEVKCVIITGSNKSFSTGGSLEYITSLSKANEIQLYFKKMDELLIKLFAFSKPLISAINGHSIGLGLLIAFTSDLVFCLDNKKIKFGFPEINMGMVLDSLMIEIINFNNIYGRQLTNLIYSGELFDVDFLRKIFDVNMVEKSETLIPISLDYFNKLIVESKIDAFTLNKKIIRQTYVDKLERMFNENCFSVFQICMKKN